MKFNQSEATGLADSQNDFPPVKLKFINNSRYPVSIHFYLQKSLVNAHFLKPKKTYEATADHSVVIQLEYTPQPYKTILKPINSENELSRTLTFTNDGEHVRIKEKFIYKKNAKITPRKKKKNQPNEEDSD
jgi:hypothetical protein